MERGADLVAKTLEKLGVTHIFTVSGNHIMPVFDSLLGTVIKLIHDNPAYAMWMKISVGLGLLVSVALLAAGIGLLKLKPWARTFSIGYAIYSLVMVPVGMVVNFFLLTRPLLEQAHQQHGPEAASAIGAAVGGLFGSCFGLIYPVLLLIFMLRANVKAAFVPTSEDGQQ